MYCGAQSRENNSLLGGKFPSWPHADWCRLSAPAKVPPLDVNTGSLGTSPGDTPNLPQRQKGSAEGLTMLNSVWEAAEPVRRGRLRGEERRGGSGQLGLGAGSRGCGAGVR